jgi:hypothetical protein
LSELSESGRHTHRVVLIPFDDKPGDAIRVDTTQDALNVIHDFKNKLGLALGGTDIQKALLKALALIADAEHISGTSLKAANIVLMTDGQAQVNLEELRQARDAISRDTPVQALFLAIGSTNPDLIQFVKDSERAGFDLSVYKEFSLETMQDYLFRSRDASLKTDRSILYTDQKVGDLSRDFFQTFEAALTVSREVSEEFSKYSKIDKPAREHLLEIDGMSTLEKMETHGSLIEWFIGLRRLAIHKIFKNRFLLEKVCDDMIQKLPLLSGVPFERFEAKEREHLRHFLRFVSGL